MADMTDATWIEQYSKTIQHSAGVDEDTANQLAREAAQDPDQRECDPVEAVREELSYWETE